MSFLLTELYSECRAVFKLKNLSFLYYFVVVVIVIFIGSLEHQYKNSSLFKALALSA